jgi:CDP-diacylglycerol--serine O-phosphatidyltransferase
MALIPTAFVLDAFDGRIARWRKVASTLGRELDSLADIISLRRRPCGAGLRLRTAGGLGLGGAVVLRGCGVSRLARYNVTAESLSGDEGKVRYFEGTPIPTSVAIVGLLALAAFQGHLGEDLWFGGVRLGPWLLHPLALVYALSGSLMISKTLRIPKP